MMVVALLVTLARAQEPPAAAPDSPYRAALDVLVDDRVAERLSGATIGVRQEGVPAVALHDDGVAPDSAAGDRIFAASLQVALAERVTVYVEDAGGSVGELSVFLPSARAAAVRLRTLADPPGLALAQEASAVGGSSGAVTSVVANDAGRDRLAHVVWVAICLFAVAFAYVRTVVAQRWSTEVQPLLARIARFLDAHERSTAARTPEPPDVPPSP